MIKVAREMIKDKSIIDLIEKLKLETNFNKVEFVDYWDGDLCAIGIKCGNRLVYISSYHFSEGKVDGYDYDFELVNEQQIEDLNVIKEVRSVTEEVLIADVKLFLEI